MAEHTAGVDVTLKDRMNRVVEPESPEAADMRRQVEAAIERDKLDPRQQMYMFNKTTNLLIRSNGMYHRAIENRDQIEIVSYKQAEQIYKREQSAKAAALAKLAKRKRAKQARKKNR